MPAFNAGDYIGEAIESVIAQTYQNWELLITDDGSTDETQEIIQKFDDPRIRWFWQKNQGASAARNLALEHVSGEFITFLDADDALPHKSIEVRVQALRRVSTADITDGVFIVYDSKLKKPLKRRPPGKQGPILSRLLELDEEVFRNGCFMFRSNILGEQRFQEGLTHSEDLLFFIQLSATHRPLYTPVYEATYHYRTGTTSAMANLDGWEEGYLILLNSLATTPELTWHQRIPTHLRIARILLATWINKRRPIRGIFSASRALLLILKAK